MIYGSRQKSATVFVISFYKSCISHLCVLYLQKINDDIIMPTTLVKPKSAPKTQKVVNKDDIPVEKDYISSKQFFKLLREEVNRHYENI